MKIKFSCPECEDDQIYHEINNLGYYEIVCKNGHKSYQVFNIEKFELLYELGILAMVDGYTRDAVSNFSASIERLYEYSIKIFILRREIRNEDFGKTWKLVSAQSERQIGAYYFLYLSEFGKPPEKIDNKWVEFRNKVIHKGYFPKYKEVEDYAKYIFNYANRVLSMLSTIEHFGQYNNLVKTQVGLLDIPDDIKKKIRRATVTFTMISTKLGKKYIEERTFEDSLKNFRVICKSVFFK